MRFSDPRQMAGSSSERQLAYAKRWAEEHGLVLDDSLSLRDEGLSAYHQRHVKSGALGTFLAAVEGGKVPAGSVLVVEGLDRLSRAEPIQAQGQLAQIVNAGITVVTASDGKAYSREHLKANPMDLVYSLLVMIRAHEESDTKSKRVVASIRRQCVGWQAGTWHGVIRNGKDPAWVRLVDGEWQLVAERVEAVRAGLELYQQGYSATRIVRALADRGLQLTDRGAQSLQIHRLVRQRALLGEKELTVDGETFVLAGYYPALLNQEEWQALQGLNDDRGRRRVKGTLPHVITGIGVTVCGYCGRAMAGQHMMNRVKADGTLLDGHRRLLCTSHSQRLPCPVPGSISVARVERALMAYCSDMMNLQRLYTGDRSAEPRARLASARKRAAALAVQLERLTDAMLASEAGGVPLTFAKRARELEAQQAAIQVEITRAERDVSAAARTHLDGADAAWRDLAAGVEALDFDARIRARQLVADTFERIVVYHKGVRPDLTPKGFTDVVLLARGGQARLLRIDKGGRWEDGEDVDQ
ncbi:recombinase family protein [Aquincola sp. J276]|nr:recombinase family protein [Aquincola sp. J276]